jgi:hypothetical protein
MEVIQYKQGSATIACVIMQLIGAVHERIARYKRLLKKYPPYRAVYDRHVDGGQGSLGHSCSQQRGDQLERLETELEGR